MKIIKSEYGLGTQSVNFKEIRESDEGLKIQINIKSDSYDFQSHAIVSVFSPTELKWNNLSSIHFSEMQTPPKLYYHVPPQGNPSVVSGHFQSDIQQLVTEAEAVLGQTFSVVPSPKKVRKMK